MSRLTKERRAREKEAGKGRTMANVTVIPATRNFHTGIRKDAVVQKRLPDMPVSARTVRSSRPATRRRWIITPTTLKTTRNGEFVGVYTDEGISATGTKHRDGFNQMIQDALDGKIDLIVTKSVSRFARNTVDSLTTVRKLKEKGVEVYSRKKTSTPLTPKGNC